MSVPIQNQAGDVVHSVILAALDTTTYIPVMKTGRVKLFSSCIGAALTVADETYTLYYAPPGSVSYTAVTGGAVVVASSGSAAGNVSEAEIAPSTTAFVTRGGSLKIVPSGGGSGAAPVVLSVLIGN